MAHEINGYQLYVTTQKRLMQAKETFNKHFKRLAETL